MRWPAISSIPHPVKRRRRPHESALCRREKFTPRVRRLETVAQPRAGRRPSGIPESGRRRDLRHQEGRDLRSRWRVRLGKDHGGANGGGIATAKLGRSDHRRRVDDECEAGTGAAAAAPPHPDDFSGPLCEPQSAFSGRCHRLRAHPRLRPDPGRARYPLARRRIVEPGRPASRRRTEIPA